MPGVEPDQPKEPAILGGPAAAFAGPRLTKCGSRATNGVVPLAVVPRPTVNLRFYHGVLAPRARWRSQVVDYGRPTPDRPGVELKPRPRAIIPTPAWTWGALMRRVFALDVLACPRCGGQLRVIDTVQDPAVVRAILAHLRLAPGPDSPGPAPPAPEHPAADSR